MFLKQNVAVEHGPKTKRDHLLALYDDRKRKVNQVAAWKRFGRVTCYGCEVGKLVRTRSAPFLTLSSVRPRVGEDQFHKSNFWFCEQIPRVWWLIKWNFIITFTWYYFISLKALTSIFKLVDEILGCDLRSNQTSSIFISHGTTVSIKLMKALTFEHVDGIQGFAGPFKRILFLPVMLSRFKKRNLFTSIEFT